ncbi:MAG: carbamoyl-phosphate synthase large subunit, partial [Dehalococcoidia bacterium]|nr:carbamoyl-phosphate synthase large subunit [Dehalococcoidia bacterium]
RSLEMGRRSLLWEDKSWGSADEHGRYPLHANDLRLWALMAALRRKIDVDQLAEQTGIDPWFIHKMANIVALEQRLLSEQLDPELLRQAKRLGFSDEQISILGDTLPDQVRQLRNRWNIKPVYKMVDTCAAEFDAETPYFYSTYEIENEAESLVDNKAVVIGSGPIRIGQGIEFDYCSVHSAWALKEAGYKSIMVNSNPETVSTDFDTSDRLYFEPLDEESVLDILENENSKLLVNAFTPSVLQFGGQTAINLAASLSRNNSPILGSNAEIIDLAEDRRRFEDFLNHLGIPQPPGTGVTAIDQGQEVARTLGYPVLVRPSYVLGGRGMEIVQNQEELTRYMGQALEIDERHPVLIDKYFEGKEVEVDAVSDGVDVLIPGIMEHIERTGVHSGDSIAVYPAPGLSEDEVNTLVDYTTRTGLALGIKGLMNIQFVIMSGSSGERSSIYMLEVNPRASRTIPFISKVTGVPMVRIATKVMLGISLAEQGYKTGLYGKKALVGVKAPVFSMSKLTGVDTYLSPEMKSTGEVMGIDLTYEAALAKALIAAGLMLPSRGTLLFSIADRNKTEALPIIRGFYDLGYQICATHGTAAMISEHGMKVDAISRKLNEGHPNIVEIIGSGSIVGVINTITGGRIPLQDGFHIRRASTERRIPCFTSLDTAGAVFKVLSQGNQNINIKPLQEYVES